VKSCAKCKDIKPFDQFRKRADGKDGRRNLCKSCEADYFTTHKCRHRLVNGDQIRAADRARYAANPDLKRLSDLRYEAANPEKKVAKNRAYHAANRASRSAYHRLYRAANHDAGLLANHRRRARKRANGVFIVSTAEIAAMLAKPCYLCGSAPSVTIDHIIPIVRGGQHSVGNLLGACSSCNGSKGSKLLIEYRVSSRRATLRLVG